MIQTKKDVLRFEGELNSIRREQMRFTETCFNEKIHESWEQLKFIAAKKQLQAMPIDTISTLGRGIPINRLAMNGFETIFDIRNKSIEDLRMINGIGEVSAQAIYEAVSKKVTSVYEAATPKLNPIIFQKKIYC
ncbi:helix-hairpin-helix domain-containing protein [Sporosarcina ureilytica]|uniref:RNA polymerase alpha subunit C-terminal domain-containing protein n=1 Tax=Sporosarcina ureilytica TaxID=298596 RepID=A0A1D8JGD5_9BACL|nr:helix-hairpin-helix domain-containing protein [Sporosarcina ureilytica]AOV07756.1 hypothetical protein BI350_09585 [Sporosarcina ureilytica]